MTAPGCNRDAAASRGWSILEVLLAIGIGTLLIGIGGFLFLGQVKGYRDIESMAKLQTQTKTAVQGMVRDIASTGASLSDKRHHFVMEAHRMQFAYVDLKGRYCGTADTVTMVLVVRKGLRGDTLAREVTCNAGPRKIIPLVAGSGSITLTFEYWNKAGYMAYTPAATKYVKFFLDMKSPKGHSLFERGRQPVIRVDLVN